MKNLGPVIIANAIIWGAVIIGISLKLKGTGLFSDLAPILIIGAAISNILIGGLLGRRKDQG